MVDIEVLAADGSKTRKSVPRLVAAKAEATKWYNLERQRLAGKLKPMPVAQAGLVEWATFKEILRRVALAKPTANAVDRDHTSAASR